MPGEMILQEDGVKVVDTELHIESPQSSTAQFTTSILERNHTTGTTITSTSVADLSESHTSWLKCLHDFANTPTSTGALTSF